MAEGVNSRQARNVRLAETVAADLRRQILDGSLPGDSLPKQDDLMETFGVSGPSLREALRILEAEGLVTVRRGKVGGADIHRPNGASAAYLMALTLQGEGTKMRDLTEALATFEPRCVSLAAESPSLIELLEPMIEENFARSEEALGDGPRFTTVAREFHDLLVDEVANPAIRLLTKTLVTVWTAQQATWAEEVSAGGRYPDLDGQKAVLQAHRRIWKRVRSGQAAAAETAAREHLTATHELLLSDVGEGRVIDAVSTRALHEFHRTRT